jgi:lipid-A-disaccharide synthase
MLKIYIIAGEASGDNIAAKLMHELKAERHDVVFYGIGGEKMQKIGMNSLFSANELSVMGFFEIIPHLVKIWFLLRKTVADIIKIEPDIVITIDSPGFCFRVAKAIKNKTSAKLIHYVAPTVWAYKPERAKKIAKIYDQLLVILPFEPEYFTKEGLETNFVGYPALEDLHVCAKEFFRYKFNVPKGDLLLCLAPGSRKQEVKALLPIFLDAANLLSKSLEQKITIAIPASGHLVHLVESFTKGNSNIILVEEKDKQDLFSSADLALTKSGTITTELGFYGIPMVVAYKINWLTHFLIKRLIKIEFATIINLLANKEVIPELLQKKCTAENLAKQLEHLTNPKHRQEQLNGISVSLEKLNPSNKSPSRVAAEKILFL